MKKFIVQKQINLKQFTDEVYPQGSFALTALLRKKDVKVNGKRVSCNVTLKSGDEVIFYTTPSQENKLSHKVVYSDENIVICDKFGGVSTEGLLSELSANGEVYAVHRLDRNTCGLIVFARNAQSKEQLELAFAERRVEKTYLAVCKDCFKKPQAYLTAYLKKDAEKSIVDVIDSPEKGYAKIETEYTILKRGGGLALVSVKLHTGKTHQIRAHMAHIGCPLLGDEKYGDGALNSTYAARRQRLVSKCLKFDIQGNLSYLQGKVFESEFSPDEL